ncbi:protein ABHD13 isoform X2 [Ceratitis capitata]|uniref:protein ABHD13 isoform X2 n=1 Tax=Ceratitis capitata TaxID=7213 RepID=UPI000A10046B|nr:protein ABHD13 isoform X2 [Ceratitis capitata]
MSQEFGGVPIALPRSRSVYAVSVAGVLAFILFYYYYGSILTLSLLFTLLSLGFYYLQDMLLYHPDLPANSRIYVPIPKMHNLPHETINIRTPDKVTLHAFWVSQPKERSKAVPTFVYFHGNAGNMGHRMQNVWGIFNHLHCNILMVDYRGYGFSTGVPSEKGGAVVIDVAADTVYGQKIMCAIVENTFTSIPDMAVELVHPSANLIPKCCFKNKYLSSWKIGKCAVPFLFISGLADNLVPPRMMRTLYMKCGSERKRILEFIGGAHNDTWIMDGYYSGIQQFLSECQSVTTAPLEKPPEKSNVWHEIQDV